MSVSKERLAQYAQQVLEPELLEAVQTRVAQAMLARFRVATPDQREVINAMMDGDAAFLSELRMIVGENVEVNPEDEEVIPVK